ncbi:MAG TPA: phage holin family protein [Edaphocola sp.]|nr:phage holin family protein [Edaphocola sp.]
MKNLLNNLRESITRYFQLRFASIRLELVDRISNVMGYFTFMLIVAFLFFFAFLYFSFGLAAWLGTLLDSRFAGMFCTGGVILVIAFITILLGKPIIRFFAGKLAVIMLRKRAREDDEDEDEAL